MVVQGDLDDLLKNIGTSRLEVIGRNINEQVLQRLQTHPEVNTLSRKDGHIKIDLEKGCDSAALVNFLVENGMKIDEVHREVIARARAGRTRSDRRASAA